MVADLAYMPHLLIAGATGSGKSVCINAIISCFLSTHTPETLRLLMVDPKMVELTNYNGVPHLLAPVVVELERVVLACLRKKPAERPQTVKALALALVPFAAAAAAVSGRHGAARAAVSADTIDILEIQVVPSPAKG